MPVRQVPVIEEITLYAGDTYVWDLIIRNDDGNVEDITNWTFTCQMRVKELDETAVTDLTVTKIDSINGHARIRLPKAESDKLRAHKRLWWDCQYETPDEDVQTLFKGRIVIEKDVSRGVVV